MREAERGVKHHLRGDWLKWVAAGFALAATASAEYELARAIGMDKVIAAAVPGALDAYVVRALRAHREVLTAVLAMVGVNAASHLVTAGVLAVDWRLITAVSAIAPLVLWRVHALSTPGEARRRALRGVPKGGYVPEHAATGDAPAGPADASTTEPEDQSPCLCSHGYHEHAQDAEGYAEGPCLVCACSGWHDETEHAQMDACSVCAPVTQTCDWCGWTECPAELLDGHKKDACVKRFEHRSTDSQTCSVKGCTVWGDLGLHERAHALGWGRDEPSTVTFDEYVSTAPGVLDYVPREWATPPVPEKRERILRSVPDLPEGYEHAGLRPGDHVYLEQARVLHARGTAMRDWKTVLKVGTARAQRLRDHIESEHTSTEEST